MNELRLVETLSGQGTVQDGSTAIPVVYHIEIYQKWIDTSSFEGKSAIPGLKQLRGSVEVVPPGQRLTVGATYSMQLSDGRRCEFWVKDLSGTVVVNHLDGI
jgi:hypothetical protein